MRHLPKSVWQPGSDVKGTWRQSLRNVIFPYPPSPVIGKVTHAGSTTHDTFFDRHMDDVAAVLALILAGIPMAAGISLRELMVPDIAVAALLWLGFHFGGRRASVTYVGENGAQFNLDKENCDLVDFREMSHLAYYEGDSYTRSYLKWFDLEDQPAGTWDVRLIDGHEEILRGWGRHLANRLEPAHEPLTFASVQEKGVCLTLSSRNLTYQDAHKEYSNPAHTLRIVGDSIVMEEIEGRDKRVTLKVRRFVDGYAALELVRKLQDSRTSVNAI